MSTEQGGSVLNPADVKAAVIKVVHIDRHGVHGMVVESPVPQAINNELFPMPVGVWNKMFEPITVDA